LIAWRRACQERERATLIAFARVRERGQIKQAVTVRAAQRLPRLAAIDRAIHGIGRVAIRDTGEDRSIFGEFDRADRGGLIVNGRRDAGD